MADTELQVKDTSLYGILDDLQALFDTLEGLEESDPNTPAVRAELELKLDAEVKKVSSIFKYRANCRAQQHYCDQMQARYLAARQEWEQAEKKLEEYVTACMQKWAKSELAGDGIKIKLKSNPASVLITNESLIPFEYIKTYQPPPVDKPDKAAIAKALKAGIDVPGCDLKIDSVRLDWGDGKTTKKKLTAGDGGDDAPLE